MVYLIHFAKSFKGCRHYIGFTRDGNLKKRMRYHKSGNGSKLLNALNKNKIGYYVARTWKDKDGNFERRLKKGKRSKRLCPICNPKSWMVNEKE